MEPNPISSLDIRDYRSQIRNSKAVKEGANQLLQAAQTHLETREEEAYRKLYEAYKAHPGEPKKVSTISSQSCSEQCRKVTAVALMSLGTAYFVFKLLCDGL